MKLIDTSTSSEIIKGRGKSLTIMTYTHTKGGEGEMKTVRIKAMAGMVFAVSLALLGVALLAFVNNVVALVRWWRAFLAAGGDTANVPSHAAGCIPWLDWSAVDYSAVTTFIPLLGFLCLTRAAWGILRGHRQATGDFPFFRGSDQLNVALGLFGTLWGIIVIGYFKLDTVTMADLMQCLHTALYSTLMAVVWVFMVDRPLVRPFFLRLLERAELAETGGGDLAAAVDRLIERLGAASDAFDRRQREYDAAFDRRLKESEAAFARRQTEYETARDRRQAAADAAVDERQKTYETTFAHRQQECEAALAKRLADYVREFEARQKEYAEFFARRIAELENKAKAAEEKRRESETRLGRVAEALRG